MSIKTARPWGLVVPGRPPTPSEGHAQSYARVGPEDSQRLITFDNGTALSFGPDDLVDEFGPGLPFGDQIAHVDRAIRDCMSIAQRYSTKREDDDNQVYKGFRTTQAHNTPTTSVRAGDFIYDQVPSRFASISTLISIYSHPNKSDATGAAHPGLSADTRFGILDKTKIGALAENDCHNTKREMQNELREHDGFERRGHQSRAPSRQIQQQGHGTQASRNRQSRRRRPHHNDSELRQKHRETSTAQLSNRMVVPHSQPSRGHQQVQTSTFQAEPNSQVLMSVFGSDYPAKQHRQILQQQQSIEPSGVSCEIHQRTAPPGFPPQRLLDSPPSPILAHPNFDDIQFERHAHLVAETVFDNTRAATVRSERPFILPSNNDTMRHHFNNPEVSQLYQHQQGPERPSQDSGTQRRRGSSSQQQQGPSHSLQSDGAQFNLANRLQQASTQMPERNEAYAHRHWPTAQRANQEYARHLDWLNQQPLTSQGLLRGDILNGELTLSLHPPTPEVASSTPNLLQEIASRNTLQMSVGSHPSVPQQAMHSPSVHSSNIRPIVWNKSESISSEEVRGRRTFAGDHRRTNALSASRSNPISAIGSERDAGGVLLSRRSSPGAGAGRRGEGPNRSSSAGHMIH